MEAAVNACLTEDLAISFVHGRLEGPSLDTLNAHLGSCSDCSQLINRVQLNRTVESRPRAPREDWREMRKEALLAEALAATAPSAQGKSGVLPRGTSIGRYVLLRRLGEGGMGVVYAAYDPELDRKVAIKLLRDDILDPARAEAHRGRLLREAQALARLSHPNVIVVHDVGTYGTQVFMAMEFVEGQTLGDWLREKKRGWREIVDAFLLAGYGLGAAHAAGLVHRDFKPENVILGHDGRVRVMDFGLARSTDPDDPTKSGPRQIFASTTDLRRSDALGEPLTETGILLGTPGYMAPEQHHGGEVDGRTDQFSFCVALYEALYGERPFAGQTIDALGLAVGQGMINEPPEEHDVPKWVRTALVRGMSVAPGDRYPSMGALITALNVKPRVRRRRVFLVAGIAAAFVALAYAGSQSARVRMCQKAEGDVLALLDAPSRTQLAAGFMATGAQGWEGSFTQFTQQLGKYLDELGHQRDTACEALTSPRTSPTLLAARMRCIDRAADEATALVKELGRADSVAVNRAVDAVYALPSPTACDDEQTPTRSSAPETERAEPLFEKLATARVQQLLGHSSEALVLAQRTVSEAQAALHDTAKAEALLRVGATQAQLNLNDTAQTALYEALFAAEAARADAIAAEAWVSLAEVVGVRKGLEEQGLQVVRHAEAAILRLGGAPVLEVRLGEAHARMLLAKGLEPQALARREANADQAQTALGKDHPLVGEALNAVADSLERMHRSHEAIVVRQRALDTLAAARGELHPSLRDPLFAFGRELLATEQPGRAIRPLERALTLGESSLPASSLSELRFLLAQALWSATQHHDRARRLAELAKEGHPRGEGQSEKLGQIDTWLSSHVL
ncbi:MAG: protein kinase domain-containing protein [Myxococcaceae bacterium]